MLLAALITNLQSSYADIQAQIEALQEQQRLIQAQLQRVGAVESKMEGAAALVAEAIADIREICPEELGNYHGVISSLFGDAPAAQILPGEDAPDSEPAPSEVPPSGDDGAVEVESSTVEGESEEFEPSTSPDVSHQVPARTLHKQPTKPLQWLATKRGIDSSMKRHQLASALVGQVTHAELREAVEQVTRVG